MKHLYYSFLLIFFIILQSKDKISSFSSDIEMNQEISQEEVFFNILYWGILRSKAILDYFSKFNVVEEELFFCHHNIIARMRNPSTNVEKFSSRLCKEKMIEYLDFIDLTNTIFETYKILVNNFLSVIGDKYKEKIEYVRKKVISSLIKEMYHIYDFVEKIKKIYKIEAERDVKTIFPQVFEKIADTINNTIESYSAHKNIFFYVDNIFIKQAKHIHFIQKIFYSYYKEFWIIIEKYRMKYLLDLYHSNISEYKLNFPTKILRKINVSENKLYFSKDTLPLIIDMNIE